MEKLVNYNGMNTNLRKMNLLILTLGLTALVGFQGIDYLRTKRAFNEAAIVADKNHDGTTSAGEWSSIYDELGLQYTGKKGKDLAKEQLRDYIFRQQK